MRQKIFIFLFIFSFFIVCTNSFAQQRKATSQVTRTITVITEPNATVWIDGVRRGETDDSGKLLVKPIAAGTRNLRVRAFGFKELEKNLVATQKGDVKITLEKTNDQAEIAFQEAEKILLEDKEKAVSFYKKAISLRPNYAEAQVALARALADSGNYDEALKAIAKARIIRPNYAEASAVEGRTYNSMTEYDKAIDSFDRAIKEGKGFQPEAYTGLALLFKDEAESAAADNDLEAEKFYYAESAKAFEKAIEQLSASEPVVYLFLGKVYENMGDKKKAIGVYERFLRDMPENEETSAVQSMIVQLKKPNTIQ